MYYKSIFVTLLGKLSLLGTKNHIFFSVILLIRKPNTAHSFTDQRPDQIAGPRDLKFRWHISYGVGA